MASTQYDVVIGGTSAKILKTEEGEGGYRRRTVRREIEQNLLTQTEEPIFSSRADRPALYQSSWAGGATWWQPLITGATIDTYNNSNHMDVWSEPGKVLPTNALTDAANTELHDNCVIGADGNGDVYAIGSTNNVNATYLDVYKWTPASDDWVQETGYHSGVTASGADPTSMIFDPTDDYFYVIDANDGDVHRFSPSGATQDANWLTASYTTRSAEIMLHRQGLIVFRASATTGAISLIDKSGPSASTVYNDGLGGTNLVGNPDISGTAPIIRRASNVVTTPEGIYYSRNTFVKGQPVVYVFRVEIDASGNWIGNPIATLPVGMVALQTTFHMGQVVVAATPDWRRIVLNDTNECEVQLFYVGEGGMGALGSILGGRDQIDETPFAFLGSQGHLLYIGGHKRLWIYDAIRGGIHTAWTWATELANGPYVAMFWAEDSSGNTGRGFVGRDRMALIYDEQTDNPDTVAAFGDDETHYVLTSNYFDGGLPMELKELTRVAILRDAGDGDQEWTVQISADDGAWADALVHSTTGETYAEADLSGTTGYRFRYRLIYQTKDTNRHPLRAVLISFTSGEMITEWDLLLDGSEFLNVDNQPQDEEDFYDAMVTLQGTGTITTLSDNYQEQTQDTDTGTTANVRIQLVEIAKNKSGEPAVRVVLREA